MAGMGRGLAYRIIRRKNARARTYGRVLPPRPPRQLRRAGRVEAQYDADASVSRSAIRANVPLLRPMLDAVAASVTPKAIRLRDAAILTADYTTAAHRGELAANDC